MLSFTFEIDEASAQRIAAAVCGRNNYTPATPEEGVEYVKQEVFAWLRNLTLTYEAELALQAVFANPNDPLRTAGLVQE